MYACRPTVDDKLSCTRLQNYTIGASLMSVSVSVSVSVPWNSSFNQLSDYAYVRMGSRYHWLLFTRMLL